MTDDRFYQIKALIPAGVKTLLDVGSGDKYFNKYYKTINLDLSGADINQDLNKKQQIELKSKSVDLVLLSQILEHLGDCAEIIAESKRISRRWVLVGLPNELTIDNRLRLLFNKPEHAGYIPYWHKHFFTIKSIEAFIVSFFGGYQKRYYLFAVKGGRFVPLKIRTFIANALPTLFAKEIYYLIDISRNQLPSRNISSK
jgi:hypothetical protein